MLVPTFQNIADAAPQSCPLSPTVVDGFAAVTHISLAAFAVVGCPSHFHPDLSLVFYRRLLINAHI
jgi:hypothetical protein